MATEEGRTVKALKEVWRKEENALCADCGKSGKAELQEVKAIVNGTDNVVMGQTTW